MAFQITFIQGIFIRYWPFACNKIVILSFNYSEVDSSESQSL